MNYRQTTLPLSRDRVHRILQEVEDKTFNGCVILSKTQGDQAIGRQEAQERYRTGTLKAGEWVVAPGWWLAHCLSREAEIRHGAFSQFGSMQARHAQWLLIVGFEPPRVATLVPDNRVDSLVSVFSNDETTALRMKAILAQIPENPPKSLLSRRQATIRGKRVMLADPEDQGNPAPQVAIHEVLVELCRVMPYLARDEHRTLRKQLNDCGVLLRSIGFKPLIERGELPPSSPKGLAGLADWLRSKTDDFELVKQDATPPSTLDLQQVITALEAQNRKNLAEAKASVGK